VVATGGWGDHTTRKLGSAASRDRDLACP
jgi:hypothetical protein